MTIYKPIPNKIDCGMWKSQIEMIILKINLVCFAVISIKTFVLQDV